MLCVVIAVSPAAMTIELLHTRAERGRSQAAVVGNSSYEPRNLSARTAVTPCGIVVLEFGPDPLRIEQEIICHRVCPLRERIPLAGQCHPIELAIFS